MNAKVELVSYGRDVIHTMKIEITYTNDEDLSLTKTTILLPTRN